MVRTNEDGMAGGRAPDASRRTFLRRMACGAGAAASTTVVAGIAARAGGAKRPRVKIGQVGIGHAHAAGKMAAFCRSPDFEVVGLAEPDPALRPAARQGVYRQVPLLSFEQLLNVPGLQAIAVETRVDDLLDVAEICVRAGLHIHLDKPPGKSLAQFKRILNDAARQGTLVQMGYMYRYNPGVVLLRDFLQKGWLGEPFSIEAVMSKVGGLAKRRRWAAISTGGMMFELGCHLIDLVVAILGPPEKVTPFRQHTARIDDSLWDNMLAVLTYPRALASVASSANEVEGFDRRHLALCGSAGTCHIQPLDRPSVRVAFADSHGAYRKGYQDIRLEPYERYVADVADMARIIRDEKEADFSYEHDLAVQETVLKASMLPVDR